MTTSEHSDTLDLEWVELPPWPRRPSDGHKGTFGSVLIVAGSRGMAGAAALAGRGALRAGAGLVRLAVPETILETVAGFEPSYAIVPLPADPQGRIDFAPPETWTLLEEQASWADAVAVGPGLGRSPELDRMIRFLAESPALERPRVFDADALNALADLGGLDHVRGPAVLTPHPGEAARLVPELAEQARHDRVGFLTTLSPRLRDSGIVFVLKGAETLIGDGRRARRNTTGNSGLATGGSGDVLTGVVAALLARGLAPFEAACLAVDRHGRAGDLGARRRGPNGLIASDLPEFIAEALREWED